MSDESPRDEGFWATEEEATLEEAAWADQMESEAGALVPVSDSTLVVEDDDAPIDPMDIPDHYDLPMHGSIPACPKCGAAIVQVDYHLHGVLSAPCGIRFGYPDIQNLGEHLCRTCTLCSYGWPEQVLHGSV